MRVENLNLPPDPLTNNQKVTEPGVKCIVPFKGAF